MSEWLLHFDEPLHARSVRVMADAHRAICDDLRILGRSPCGFDAIALPPMGSACGFEQVEVSIDCERCVLTARGLETPLPDTVMLNGPLIRRPAQVVDGDDVLRSLEHWLDRMTDPITVRSSERAAIVRRDLSYLTRAVAHGFARNWSRAVVRSSGVGRHHLRLRIADGIGFADMDFVSGLGRPGVGRMSGTLVAAFDDIVGEHTHVSAWNAARPADRLPVTMGSTPFIDVGDPQDHMATLRGCAALPDGALLIAP
ncbi:hypothetical protein KV697_14140 [Sphingomonas sanguinis]|uniref:hypothetical protein n=1 Tax=Sphingomonas sanguinis TaxID=33051 RepID=UPI001C57B1D0|nr:hypothetical protein [Sphingomonas sanguinis]QXT34910.1 hypothetical protein KV697_14140 [Sphingomonas sanguinis]